MNKYNRLIEYISLTCDTQSNCFDKEIIDLQLSKRECKMIIKALTKANEIRKNSQALRTITEQKEENL